MPIELVIFDCDGILVDSEHITCSVLTEEVVRLGLDWDVAETTQTHRGGSLPLVIEAIEAERGVPMPDDWVPRFRERLFVRLREEVGVVSGIVDALDALPYPFCVASNGPHEKMRATLGATGLLPRFEGRMLSAYDVGRFKPDPDLFLRAASMFDVAPARCVVVEDSSHGIAAAHAAGMRTVGYVDSGRTLGATPTLLLRDMRGLVAALATIAQNGLDP